MVKSLIRRFLPISVLRLYHFLLAKLAASVYGHPSSRLVVIGVTGTNGKSTTVHFIGRLLEHAGCRVGWTSTADFKVGLREWTNDQKMTMLGRFQTQKLLRDMVRAGCTHAIIETSSQGVAQSRHIGINYDVVACTNLTPEHIESHGGFENYKKAKGELFAYVAASQNKAVPGAPAEKIAIANLDDEHAGYFLSFGFKRQYGFGIDGHARSGAVLRANFTPFLAEHPALDATCSTFFVDGRPFHLKPLGRFNVSNAVAAITALRALGFEWKLIQDGVSTLEYVPGRLEAIDEGQPFRVIVDYAYEPAALQASYEAIRLFSRRRLIHLLGSAGGGRDAARRRILGEMAGKEADIVIVANEDPYDDDPMEIINQVADGALSAGKQDGANLFRILDREEAIRKAIGMAEPGDVVFLTGKGNEPVMALAHGKKTPWDDRLAARKAIHLRFS